MNDAPRGRRISITKRQRQTAAGADLLALCQAVTEDGTLSTEEVDALRQWLTDNAAIDLPAKDYLRLTVEKVIADGRVTPEELEQLYRAIEVVLPPDVRGIVRERRRAVEQAAQQAARVEREAQRHNAPIDKWDFMVAGTRYEGRPAIISRYAGVGDVVYLARDPDNPYSRNAVEVRLANGLQIGFVPELMAVDMAPLLDAGHPHEARIKKILTGGRSPIPVVLAFVYAQDARRDGLVRQDQVPAKVTVSVEEPSAAQRTGYGGLVWLLVAVLTLAVGILIGMWR